MAAKRFCHGVRVEPITQFKFALSCNTRELSAGSCFSGWDCGCNRSWAQQYREDIRFVFFFEYTQDKVFRVWP